MPRILYYVDPISGGHHTEHLRFYAAVAASMKIEIAAFVPVETWDTLSPDERTGMRRHDPVNLERVNLLSGAGQIGQLAGLVGQRAGSAVFFPVIDDYVPALATLSAFGRTAPFSWGGVYFRDSFNFPQDERRRFGASARSAVKLGLLRAAMRHGGRGLLTLDPYWNTPIGAPVYWLPDALSSLDATRSLPAPRTQPGRTVFLMFGEIAPRKGLLEFLAAMGLLADSELSSMTLKVAGRFSADRNHKAAALEGMDAIRRRGGDIEISDMFVSNDDLESLLLEADVVLVNYINHLGSSGALGLAVRYGRPVIAQNTYQIGREVVEHDLGTVVNTSDPPAIADAIRSRLGTPPPPTDPNGTFRQSRRFEAAFAVTQDFLSSLYETSPRPAIVPAVAPC